MDFHQFAAKSGAGGETTLRRYPLSGSVHSDRETAIKLTGFDSASAMRRETSSRKRCKGVPTWRQWAEFGSLDSG